MKNSGLRRDYKACSYRLHPPAHSVAVVSRETLGKPELSPPKTTTAIVPRETIAVSSEVGEIT